MIQSLICGDLVFEKKKIKSSIIQSLVSNFHDIYFIFSWLIVLKILINDPIYDREFFEDAVYDSDFLAIPYNFKIVY